MSSLFLGKNLKFVIAIIIICLLLLCSIVIYYFYNTSSLATSSNVLESTIAKSTEKQIIRNSSTKNDKNQEVITVYLDSPIATSTSSATETTLDDSSSNNANQEQANTEPQENRAPNTITQTIAPEEPEVVDIAYYIKINYTENTLTVYGKDADGNYTVPMKAFACSTGKATPRSGVYPLKPYRGTWVGLMGGVCGQYGWQIVGDIMLHSVPYSRRGDKTSLITSYYDKLGTTASAGCIRLTVEAAKWIYDNCVVGTNVEFYSSSDPGPLGKPSTQKISDYDSPYRNWDPTDPDPDNPWHSLDASNINTGTISSNNNPPSVSHDITITVP